MEEHGNIVQAEFFHVGKKPDSLEDLMEEYSDRIADDLSYIMESSGSGAEFLTKLGELDPGIKTTVRFFDEDNSFTHALSQYLGRHKWRDEIEQTLPEARGLYRRFLNFRHRRLTGKLIDLREFHHRLAMERVRALARGTRALAVEKGPQRKFRYVRDEELHELQEAVQRTHNAWIFLYQPGDLLTEYRLIASAM